MAPRAIVIAALLLAVTCMATAAATGDSDKPVGIHTCKDGFYWSAKNKTCQPFPPDAVAWTSHYSSNAHKWSGWLYFAKGYYKLGAARDVCIELGGDLAKLPSRTDNDEFAAWVAQTNVDQKLAQDEIFSGLVTYVVDGSNTPSEDPNDWVWIADDHTPTYEAWQRVNGQRAYPSATYGAYGLLVPSLATGEWQNGYTVWPRRFVCELPA